MVKSHELSYIQSYAGTNSPATDILLRTIGSHDYKKRYDQVFSIPVTFKHIYHKKGMEGKQG